MNPIDLHWIESNEAFPRFSPVARFTQASSHLGQDALQEAETLNKLTPAFPQIHPGHIHQGLRPVETVALGGGEQQQQQQKMCETPGCIGR